MALIERSEFISGASARFDPGFQEVIVDEISDGNIRITATTLHGGFLVLSEAYYPGWRVRIGNSYQPIERVNIAHQGVRLPPGQHHVIFEFNPMSLYVGYWLTSFAIVLVVILGFWKMNANTRITTSHESQNVGVEDLPKTTDQRIHQAHQSSPVGFRRVTTVSPSLTPSHLPVHWLSTTRPER